jgi:hypothetical protein
MQTSLFDTRRKIQPPALENKPGVRRNDVHMIWLDTAAVHHGTDDHGCGASEDLDESAFVRRIEMMNDDDPDTRVCT